MEKNIDIKKFNENTIDINQDKYQVEMGEDISIPVIPETIADRKEEITGYTAGLITRDLVAIGEQLIANKQNKNK